MALDSNYWKNSIIILMLILGIFGVSCQPSPVSLNRSERMLLDSLYDDYRDSLLRPRLEDSCEAMIDHYFQHWVDSLVEERKLELYEILGQNQ